MFYVRLVETSVRHLFWVKLPHPTSTTDRPMLKRQLIGEFSIKSRSPFESNRLARIVESVLGISPGNQKMLRRAPLNSTT